MGRRTFFLFIYLLLLTCHLHGQYSWRPKACLPTLGRNGGATFGLGTKAYYVGGSTITTGVIAEVWEYDETTNTWTQKNNFPGPRSNGSSFIINDTAYVGLGVDANGTFHTDFWRYNQGNDTWTQVTSFPGGARYTAMAFAVNGKGYVGCGFNGGLFNDFYQYDPGTNAWVQKTNFPGSARQTGFGAAVGSFGYIGLGADYIENSDVYKYDPSSDSWSSVANFGGAARHAMNCFVLNGSIYISGGASPVNGPYTFYSDCWKYDPANNTWTQQAGFPCLGNPLDNLAGFNINNHGYFAGGTGAITPGGNTLYFSNVLYEFESDDNSFISRMHILGNDTSYCGNFSQVLSTGNPCTLWSTGVTASRITVTTPGTYWAYFPNSCGMASDTIHINIGSIGSVTIAGDTIICSSDSARVCAPSGYTSYHWNNGGSGNCIEARQAGNYYVTITEAGGCTAESNHVLISVYPVPSVTIVVQGDTLTSFGSVSYHWYLNGAPINNATSDMYVARAPGLYSVEVTDTNGCFTLSNPVDLTGISELIEEHVSLFPNPSAGNWLLTVGNELFGSKLKVYDEEGRLVFQSEIRNLQSEINLNVPAGIYWLQISSLNASITKKLVRL